MSQVETHFACDGCGKRYKWKPQIAGRKAKCGCGNVMAVPMSMGVNVEAAPRVVEPVMQMATPVMEAPGTSEIAESARPIQEALPAQAEEDIYGMAGDEKPKPARRVPIAPMPEEMTATPMPARRLGYATPKDDGPPLLGDADIDWVMKLRNSARLMVAALGFNAISRWFVPAAFDAEVMIIIAGINLVAIWLFTSQEPGTKNDYFSARFILRIIGCITGVAQIVMGVASLSESGAGLIAGAAGYLLIIPETFVFLWYLRKLAIRLPNIGLAVNCVIVMIGLPAVLLGAAGGAFMGARTHSPGMMILSGIGGVLGLLLFRIWYIILLVWFNKSFS